MSTAAEPTARLPITEDTLDEICMTVDFGPLVDALQRVCPTSSLEPVVEAELEAIRRGHPGVPSHYLAFLREVGYGMLGGTLMLYNGLVDPEEIFATRAASLEGIAFFGDFCGETIVGFDTRHGWRLVEVEHATLDIDPLEEWTVGEFFARWLVEQEETEPSAGPDPNGGVGSS